MATRLKIKKRYRKAALFSIMAYNDLTFWCRGLSHRFRRSQSRGFDRLGAARFAFFVRFAYRFLRLCLRFILRNSGSGKGKNDSGGSKYFLHDCVV
jgi:hypothetical protein